MARDGEGYGGAGFPRLAAKRWCVDLDNQFRHSTGHVGLKMFVKPKEAEGRWRNWRTWPYIALPMDLGSNGNSGYHALERHFKINTDQHNDPQHGCHRDLDNTLTQMQCSSYWFLQLIASNYGHGDPKEDKAQMHKCKQTMRAIYTRFPDCRDVPLFMDDADNIIKELRAFGHDISGPNSEQQAYNICRLPGRGWEWEEVAGGGGGRGRR